MKVGNKYFTTIWVNDKNNRIIQVIDQGKLPHKFIIQDLKTFQDAVDAINNMTVRGAPLIGVTAAYAMYLAALESEKSRDFDTRIREAADALINTRPTAVDLFKAVDKQLKTINTQPTISGKILSTFETAGRIRLEAIEISKNIGKNGLGIIEELSTRKNGAAVNILTHCNAGWLATVDYGTATAPIYMAFDKGIKLHVWVDETRPRNQGASLTAWELLNHGIPHTVITDNAGGHLMQHGMVDIVIVGTDRTTRRGDVANKIGTYLKALAAKDNNIPFYVAAPSSSIDFSIKNGLTEIIIEQRNENEVKYIQGLHQGEIKKVLLTPEDSPAANYGFDVTPSHLITSLITEKGVCEANEEGILGLYPEYK